jgi:hypothetical protein
MTNCYIEYFEPHHFGNDWGIFVDIENQNQKLSEINIDKFKKFKKVDKIDKLDENNKLDTCSNKLISSYIIHIYSILILFYYMYYLFVF